jgi:pyruvate dehydrogenase E1 component beta subunit
MNEQTGTIGTNRMTYREACRQAIRHALIDDPRTFLMGEDVGLYGGCYAVSKGLLQEFGPGRIRDTPLAEAAFVGAGIGAAMAGMRPIVEIMTCNFSLLALDQIMNNAATIPHMSGGQIAVPLVIRMATGGGRQLAAQHSHSLEGWFAHIPGLKVLVPGTVEDARFMLKAALADPNPVLIFEHIVLYNAEGELDPEVEEVDIEKAKVRRPGNDVSILTYGNSLPKSLEAAEKLAEEGIDAEVVDLRVLRPLDNATIFDSVSRTRRCVIVDEGWKSGSISAEIAARLAEDMFFELDAPIRRICSREVPVPYAAHMEEAALPQTDQIVEAARGLARGKMSDFLMPSLGADMESGKIVEWLVKPGATVKKGDVIAVVETHKGAFEIDIFEEGVVTELCAKEGEELPVGALLARIGAPGEKPAKAEPVPPPVEEKPAPPPPCRSAAAGREAGTVRTRTRTRPGRRRRPDRARIGRTRQGKPGCAAPGGRTRYRSRNAGRHRHRRLGHAGRCRACREQGGSGQGLLSGPGT